MSEDYDNHRNRSPYFKIIEGLTRRCFYENTKNKTFSRGLDIGCGTGRNIPFFLEKCKRVEGMDYTPGMLKNAQQTFREFKNVHLMIGDVQSLPFSDKAFDLVGCFKVLPHVPGVDKSLKEISRVSRKGSTIFLEFYSPYSFRRLLNRMPHYTKWHSVKNVTQLIKNANLKVIKIYGARTFMITEYLCYLPGGYFLFNFLENFFTNTLLNRFSGYYIVVCEKQI
tara:strand:+ start:127 stop:798 length:672 start_codon:yes stop_codon:yes gene_type:complete